MRVSGIQTPAPSDLNQINLLNIYVLGKQFSFTRPSTVKRQGNIASLQASREHSSGSLYLRLNSAKRYPLWYPLSQTIENNLFIGRGGGIRRRAPRNPPCF